MDLVVVRAGVVAAMATLLFGCGDDGSPGGGGAGGAGGGGGVAASGGAGGGGGGAGGGGAGGGGAGGEGWLAVQGQACPLEGCPEPLECVTYCGFAGCNDSQFSECHIRCGQGFPDCPLEQMCVNIADGPGDVCQP